MCSDGSFDDTDRIAARCVAAGVRLLRNDVRLGKAATLDRLVGVATGDLLLVVDAGTRLEPRSLGLLVAALSSSTAGLALSRHVAGDLPPVAGRVAPTAEPWEPRLEAERELLAPSGSAYLVRRALMPVLPKDTVSDVMAVTMTLHSAGWRVAYVRDAVVSQEPAKSALAAYHRYVRAAVGRWQALWRYRRLFSKRGPLVVPLTREVLRAFAPVFLVGVVVMLTRQGSTGDDSDTAIAGGVSLALLGALTASVPLRGLRRARAPRALGLFLLEQAALFEGALRFILRSPQGFSWRARVPGALDLAHVARIPLAVRAIKRSVDLVLGSLALLASAPVLAVLAIWIRIDSGGPAIYRQQRIGPGPDGRPREFTMFKLRTMVTNAESASGAIWSTVGDVRVTRLGRFLRDHRLDELTQFANVLLGDMSIVGPRPERAAIAASMERSIPGYADRTMVLKPGITGWAQVTCGYDTSVDSVKEKLAHDLVYLAHLYHVRSFLGMELKVLALTLPVMLRGHRVS